MKRFVWIVVGGVALGAAAAALVQTGAFSGSRTSTEQPETSPQPVEPVTPEPAPEEGRQRPTPPPTRQPDTRPDPEPVPSPTDRSSTPAPEAQEGSSALTDAERARRARERAVERTEERRRLAEQREQRDREAQMRRLAQERAKAREAMLERRRQLTDRGDQVTRPLGQRATTSQSPTRPDVLEAQRRFRQDLTAQTGRRGDDEPGGDGVGTTGGSGETGDGAPVQDGGVPAELQGDGAAGPRDAADGQGAGGEQQAGGQTAGQGAGQAGGQGGQAPLPVLDGGGGPGGGFMQPRETLSTGNRNLDLNTEIQPVAFWAPAGERTLEDGTRVFANDLFIGFLSPPAGPVFTSNDENGLRIEGAPFFQVARPTPNGPLTQQERDAIPLAAVDSFLTISEAEPFFTPGGEPDPAGWGQALMAEWATTDFENAEAIQDAELFGDDRFYVRVARVGAAEGVTMVGGSLTATWIDPFSFAQLQRVVQVPHVEDLWPEVSTEPTEPTGASLSIQPAEITGAGFATAVLTLDGPAGEGGEPWLITSSDPAVVSVPTSLVVAQGEDEATFNVETEAVDAPATVTVTATSGDRRAEATITVTPVASGPSLDRFTIQPGQTRGGRSVQGTIRLGRAAPEGGVEVALTSSDPSAASVPETATVPRGAISVRVTVSTFEVSSRTTVEIMAMLAGETRAATLIVTSVVFGDVNGDGVIDGLDLAALLNAMGSGDEAADLDGDGVVDLDDLRALIDLLESGGEGGGGEGPSGPGTVVARWEPAPITGCDELSGFRSADLYLGFEGEPGAVGVTSPPGTGLRLEEGAFYQHEFGSNEPPQPGLVSTFPCAEYDSHVTVGEASPFFTPTFPVPNALDWNGALVAEWLQQPGAPLQVIVDPDRFGDDRRYVRIGRFTVPVGTPFLGGVLEITLVSGGTSFDEDVTVHHCPGCWGEFDLNNDGLVTDGDLEIMISLLDSDDERADLDGDGVVDLDDLRLLLSAIGS